MHRIICAVGVALIIGSLGAEALFADNTSQNSWLQELEGFTHQVTGTEKIPAADGTAAATSSANNTASAPFGGLFGATSRSKKVKMHTAKKGGSKTSHRPKSKKPKSKKRKARKSRKSQA